MKLVSDNGVIKVFIISAQELAEMCKKTGWTPDLLKTVMQAQK